MRKAAQYLSFMLAAAGLAVAIAGSLPASGQPGTVALAKVVQIGAVVELFTSQGCSSCPRADKLFESYAKRNDVLALSFSVDYWDYLGWKDTLASPRFTQRQRAYAKTRGDGQIYTPQLIVNGLTHVNGASHREIEGALNSTASQTTPAWVPMSMRLEAGHLEVAIGRGENAGRTVTYHNVVRDVMPIGMWSGKHMTVRLDRQSLAQRGHDADEMLAVVLQRGQAGMIIGAAMLGQ
jgi:hypothetical protein